MNLPSRLRNRRLRTHLTQTRSGDEVAYFIAEDLDTGERFRISDEEATQIAYLDSDSIPELVEPSSPRVRAHNEALEISNSLFKQSYETLIKQLYGIPVEVPEYLIVNGLRVSFIPFQQVVQMLSQNQIERYILDPLLQPWAGPPSSPNRILTMFGKNGITYLVKARYDQTTNQIYSPV